MTNEIPEDDLGLYRDGGVHRWRALFRVLAAEWPIDLPLRLGLASSANDTAWVRSIAADVVTTLDSIIDGRTEGASAIDHSVFHDQSRAVIQQAMDRLAGSIGPERAMKLRDLGCLGNTAAEFVWHVLFRRLQKAERRKKGAVAVLLGIQNIDADILMTLVDRHLGSIPEREALISRASGTGQGVDCASESDTLPGTAIDIIRTITIRRLLPAIQEHSSEEVKKAVRRWAIESKDALGVHETVDLAI